MLYVKIVGGVNVTDSSQWNGGIHMIYYNTLKLDGQSRLYLDSRVRDSLRLQPDDAVDVLVVGRNIVITSHDDSIEISEKELEAINDLKRITQHLKHEQYR